MSLVNKVTHHAHTHLLFSCPGGSPCQIHCKTTVRYYFGLFCHVLFHISLHNPGGVFVFITPLKGTRFRIVPDCTLQPCRAGKVVGLSKNMGSTNFFASIQLAFFMFSIQHPLFSMYVADVNICILKMCANTV